MHDHISVNTHPQRHPIYIYIYIRRMYIIDIERTITTTREIYIWTASIRCHNCRSCCLMPVRCSVDQKHARQRAPRNEKRLCIRIRRCGISIYIYNYLSISISISLYIFLSIYIYLSIYHIYLSISIYLSFISIYHIYLSISIYQSISIYLSI